MFFFTCLSTFYLCLSESKWFLPVTRFCTRQQQLVLFAQSRNLICKLFFFHSSNISKTHSHSPPSSDSCWISELEPATVDLQFFLWVSGEMKLRFGNVTACLSQRDHKSLVIHGDIACHGFSSEQRGGAMRAHEVCIHRQLALTITERSFFLPQTTMLLKLLKPLIRSPADTSEQTWWHNETFA